MEPNTEKVYPPTSYLVAYEDIEFLNRDDLRPVRLQLELLKPELIMEEHKSFPTVVVFGSARLLSREEAEKNLADAEKKAAQSPDQPDVQKALVRARRLVENRATMKRPESLPGLFHQPVNWAEASAILLWLPVAVRGSWEAANRGADEAGAKSIGLNSTLPFEQKPNPYITPELCFQFHYFALRKMHFLLRTKALVVFPGGFGTLDEMFETLTLIQTQKMKAIPVLLFGQSYWNQAFNLSFWLNRGPSLLKICSF